MNLETKRRDLLKVLLIASVISTAFHNMDNYRYFEQYPQPEWITLPGIFRSWIMWTTFGVAGYWMYKNQRFWPSYICLAIYSTCGLSSLVHYLYGTMAEFSAKMHFFILTDGLAGFAILGFTLWSSWILKEQLRYKHFTDEKTSA